MSQQHNQSGWEEDDDDETVPQVYQHNTTYTDRFGTVHISLQQPMDEKIILGNANYLSKKRNQR